MGTSSSKKTSSKTTKAKAAKADVKKAPKAAPKAVAAKTPNNSKPQKSRVEAPVVAQAAAPEVVTEHKGKARILSREFLVELASAIREAVAHAANDPKNREIVGTATSGDTTFELDRIGEKALLAFLKNARLPVAYYSEDSGYTTFTNTQPQNLLIIDPIDGTRAAKGGFEGCTVSIASTRVIERPTMADVDNAIVMEIMGDRTFYAERGKGVRITQDGHAKRHKVSTKEDLETLCWAMTVPGRPAELIFPTSAKLIDLTSLKGGFFACNSTSYSLTRLVTGQYDACVDIANRFLRDIPDLVRDYFINAGRGNILGIAPYDLVGALLIAQEAGCTVTDAYGKSFDDVLLLDTSVENQRSLIAAGDADMHAKLLNFYDVRIRQWEELLRRRAELAG